MKEALRQCWQTQLKLLTFRLNTEQLLSLGERDFYWGLFWVWLAGIGRAWDNPHAELFKRSGLPSVIYIFVLALFLWLFIAPLKPANWSLKRLIILISMTGIIGMLYAIPLEMILPPENAAFGNTIFLCIVALWRVAILTFYLLKTAKLHIANAVVAVLLPLLTIINLLLVSDTFAHTFTVMGGIRYYVLVDAAAAERAREAAEKESAANNTQFINPGPQPLKDKETGKLVPNVYVEYTWGHEQAASGYKEIEWGDPRYVSTTPLMNILRLLEGFTKTLWPILMVYYVAVGIVVPMVKHSIWLLKEMFGKRPLESDSPPQENSGAVEAERTDNEEGAGDKAS